MTTPKKASTRKTTTKRGPTKAAALKALGLTAEDLAVIKSLREGVEAAKEFDGPKAETSAVEADIVETAIESHSEQKAQHRDALGITPSPSIAEQVEVAREEARRAEAKKQGVSEGPEFYVRNLHYIDVGFRLESQEGQGKKRTDLKPRGQRGDLKKIANKDLNDSNLLQQIQIGLVEIITEKEARDIISKQSTNDAQRPHPALASLRNELGQEYSEDAIKVEVPFEDQGVVVAHLTPQGGGAGELPSQGKRGINWEQARQGIQQNAGTGGNPAIISDGFARNDAAAAQDAIARRKDIEGPAAGLGDVKVVLESPKKVVNVKD